MKGVQNVKWVKMGLGGKHGDSKISDTFSSIDLVHLLMAGPLQSPVFPILAQIPTASSLCGRPGEPVTTTVRLMICLCSTHSPPEIPISLRIKARIPEIRPQLLL